MTPADAMRSVTRTISVLRVFTPEEPELSPADIVRKLGIPKPTVYRILACLTKYGLLEKNRRNGSYTVGPVLCTLGSIYLSTTDLLKVSEPVIETLNNLTGEVTNVAILDDKGHIIFVLREESKHALRIGFHVGYTSPAYANALGKALLSELPDTEIDHLYPEEILKPLTRKTVPTKTELKRELEQIRKTGVSVNSEQAVEGVEAVAAVIRDDRGRTIAATGIGVPKVRMNEARLQKLSVLIKLGADLISYRLGYQDPDNPPRNIEEIRDWWERNQNGPDNPAQEVNQVSKLDKEKIL